MMGKLRMSGWWISPPLKTQRSHRFASQYYLPTIYLIFLSYFLHSLVLVLYKALNGIRFDTRLRLDNLIICPLGFTTTMVWNYLLFIIFYLIIGQFKFNSKIKLIELNMMVIEIIKSNFIWAYFSKAVHRPETSPNGLIPKFWAKLRAWWGQAKRVQA